MNNQIHENIYTFTAENGDIMRDVSTVNYVTNNHRCEYTDRFINDVLVSKTITNFVNGYKHGYQYISKINMDNTFQNFRNNYYNGELQNH